MNADSPAATADYCRRARRIRASFAKAPLLRHRALGELAEQRNVEIEAIRVRTAARRVGPVSSRPVISVIEQGFADYAATKLQPYGFDFCDRVKLLNGAQKLGIHRFRANMILALQEHHAPMRLVASPEDTGKSTAPSLLLILCIEVAVLGAFVLAWNLFSG